MVANIRSPAEARKLLVNLPNAHSFLVDSQPSSADQQGMDYDAHGHLALSLLQPLHLPQAADFYLCGPPAFLTELTSALQSWFCSLLTHSLGNLRYRICGDAGDCIGCAKDSTPASRQRRRRSENILYSEWSVGAVGCAVSKPPRIRGGLRCPGQVGMPAAYAICASRGLSTAKSAMPLSPWSDLRMGMFCSVVRLRCLRPSSIFRETCPNWFEMPRFRDLFL